MNRYVIVFFNSGDQILGSGFREADNINDLSWSIILDIESNKWMTIFEGVISRANFDDKASLRCCVRSSEIARFVMEIWPNAEPIEEMKVWPNQIYPEEESK